MSDTASFRFCDELGGDGFGWIAEEPSTRCSHALASEGKVWLVDPLDFPEAIERALALGRPAGVLQLLDRHNRDCAALAERLRVPRLVAPDEVFDSPFECIPIARRRLWRESALWWPATETLVVADALGTNPFYTGGKASVGVHLLLRLTPPTALRGRGPEHLLTGHGEGLHGPGTADAVKLALSESRRRLPGVLLRIPFSARS